MNNDGSDILMQLFEIINKHIRSSEGKPDKMSEQELLIVHRVCLVMLDIHEKTMLDFGIQQSDIENNIMVLEAARKINDLQELGLEDCNMPGGDA